MLEQALHWIGRKAVEAEVIEVIEVDETKFTARPLSVVPDKPLVKPEVVPHSTLRSLVSYLEANPDKIADGTFLSVTSPTEVQLLSPSMGRTEERKLYAKASANPPRHSFEKYMAIEEMGIYLRTCFEQTEERDALVSFLGGVKDTTEVDTKDDGVTQTVTVRAGLSMVKDGDVPGSIELVPFRTFHDVAQPASPFVVRMRKGGDGPQAAIFGADGGAWQHEATERVAAYLTRELDGSFSVFA